MNTEMKLLYDISMLIEELKTIKTTLRNKNKHTDEISVAIEECEYIQVGLSSIIEKVDFNLEMKKEDFITYTNEIITSLQKDIKELQQ